MSSTRSFWTRAWSLGLIVVVLATLAGCSAGAAPASSAAPTTAASPAAAANGGAASAAQAPAAGDTPAGWDQTVAAAKQEGQLMVITPPGSTYRKTLDAFSQTYGIQVSQQTGNGDPDLGPLVANAIQAGQVQWDVTFHSPRVLFTAFKSVGALADLRSQIVLPEVLDDSKWSGGFEDGWADTDKNLDYTFVAQAGVNVAVNRSIIPESQLSTVEQLWDPQWKGKIAIQDPRVGSAGSNATGTWLAALGEDKLRSFFTDQQPVVTADRRQLMDWLVRGNYPIIVGPDPATMADYKAQGIDMSMIQTLGADEAIGNSYSAGTGAEGIFKNAPHPNAAKLFVNWLLTQEGQAEFSKDNGYNSRRNDVPLYDPTLQLNPNIQYINLQIEQNWPVQQQALDIANELLN